MTHLTPEDLIELHYREGSDATTAQAHLDSCEACSTANAALALDLDKWTPVAMPEKNAAFAEQLWQSLRPSLQPYPSHSRRWFRLTPRFGIALAAAAAILVVAGFFAGRRWERNRPLPEVAGQHQTGPTQNTPHVVVFVLTDHLDRSERLLIELNHPDEAAVDPELQATARELLHENQLYLKTAAQDTHQSTPPAGMQTSDPALGITLDDLELVLTQVANNTGGLTRDRITRIESELNTGGLLFEVRVLRSHAHSQQAQTTLARKGGIA